MTIDIVTVYTARPTHEKFMDFVRLLKLQRATARKFGYRHILLTDAPVLNEDEILVPHIGELSLMHAIMAAQIEYIRRWDGKRHAVLVDVDCLVARPLESAFMLPFDLGLTNREDPKAPINNGAMYLRANQPKVLEFFERAEKLCHNRWGGDQEAISLAAAPVPSDHRIVCRDGLNIAFLSMRGYNCIPRERGLKHKKNPFIVHFKGEERKDWMETYARSFIL